MAEKETALTPELDEDGKPIAGGGEGGEDSPKIISKTDDEEAEPIIQLRKSSLQNIIARKNRTIEKLRSKDDEEDDFKPSKGDEEDDDEGGLTPEARGAVQREVELAIGPVIKTLASKADEDELQELFSQEPESLKYQKRIRAYMGHKSYQGVPPSMIFHHLAFDAAETTGANRKKAADLGAGQGRGGGRISKTTGAGTGAIPSIEEQNEMGDADFEALQHRVRTGEFVKRDE